jgi:hypothetical protein
VLVLADSEPACLDAGAPRRSFASCASRRLGQRAPLPGRIGLRFANQIAVRWGCAVRLAARVGIGRPPGIPARSGAAFLALAACPDGERTHVVGWAERAAALTSHVCVDLDAARPVLADVPRRRRRKGRAVAVVIGVGGGQVRPCGTPVSAALEAGGAAAGAVDRSDAAPTSACRATTILHVLPTAISSTACGRRSPLGGAGV